MQPSEHGAIVAFATVGTSLLIFSDMPTIVVVLKFYKLSGHSAVNQFLPDSDVGMSLLSC